MFCTGTFFFSEREVFVEKSMWSNHSIVCTTMVVIWIILWNGFNVGK